MQATGYAGGHDYILMEKSSKLVQWLEAKVF